MTTTTPTPAMVAGSDVFAFMEKMRATGPSWKTDVSLRCMCYEPYRRWEVEVREVWGHISLPTFIGADPVRTLEAANAYLVKFVDGGYDDDMAWIDDDGNIRGNQSNAGGHALNDMGEIHLDWDKRDDR